jgi:hypothetical protein
MLAVAVLLATKTKRKFYFLINHLLKYGLYKITDFWLAVMYACQSSLVLGVHFNFFFF